MNRNQELLENMHKNFVPNAIPFVFLHLSEAEARQADGDEILNASNYIYVTECFSVASQRNRYPLWTDTLPGYESRQELRNHQAIAVLDNAGRILFLEESLGTGPLRVFKSNCASINTTLRIDAIAIDHGIPTSARLVLRLGSIERGADWGSPESYASRELANSHGKGGGKYLVSLKLQEILTGSNSSKLKPSVLGIVGNPRACNTIHVGSHGFSSEPELNYVLTSTENCLPPSIPQRVHPPVTTRIADRFFKAYFDYLNTSLARVPFYKDTSIIFSRKCIPMSVTENRYRIEICMSVKVEVRGAIGVSPSVIPRDSFTALEDILKDVNDHPSSSNRERNTRAPYLPEYNLKGNSGCPIHSRSITPLKRDLNFDVILFSEEVVTDNPYKYRIGLHRLISGVNEDVVEMMLEPIFYFSESVLEEMAREYLDRIGNNILSLYFDDEKAGIMRNNFMCSIDAYKNRFFVDKDPNNFREFTEKLNKQLNLCYEIMLSIIEEANSDIDVRDKSMNIISMLPEVSSPSRIDTVFSKRKDHLVFKREDGQLAYYKLQLELGSGQTACHRIKRFPKVFADGIVIAPDKTYYRVTAEDLIRGRILRSQEITYEQVLGELNHESNRATADSRRDAAGGISPSSDYEEFGFSEDIGDEESRLIDMAVQNQIHTLRN